VAEKSGITTEALQTALAAAGLDAATMAAIVQGLPPDVGVTRNVVAKEGDGLATSNGATKGLPSAGKTFARR